MPSNLANQVAETWQQLVNHYHWQYTPNLSTIIDQTVAWCQNEAIDDPIIIKRRLILQYNQMLYHGLQQNVEDAALDLQRACIQAVRKFRCPPDELEDFAAEAVMTVIRKLNEINPERLLAYAFACIRNALKSKIKTPIILSLNEQYHGFNGAIDQALHTVEQDSTETALKHLLEETVGNQLEFEIIYRSYFLDETPRVIATELGMKPEQVRLIKCRTRKKLCNNSQVMQVFEQLLVES